MTMHCLDFEQHWEVRIVFLEVLIVGATKSTICVYIIFYMYAVLILLKFAKVLL